MIWIFKSDKASAFSCETDADLFQHIQTIENLKLLEDHPEFGQDPWSFTYFSPQRVVALYTHTPSYFRTSVLQQAYERELGVIEICKGDIEIRLEILALPDLDIQALRKQWCLAYCQAHDYLVVENVSQGVSTSWQSDGLSQWVAPEEMTGLKENDSQSGYAASLLF